MYQIYITGNYFFLKYPEAELPISDFKSEVLVSLINEPRSLFSIESPRIGKAEVLLSDMVDSELMPYTLETFTSFYTSKTGFNVATTESVAAIENQLSEHISNESNPHSVTLGQAMSSGNIASDSLEMNNFPIRSLPDGVLPNDPATIAQLAASVLSSAIMAKTLTGLNVLGASIVDTDTIIQAFGKLQNQINGVLGGAIYQSTWSVATNTPSLVNGTGTKGHYYVASNNGDVDFGAGSISFSTGDWAIYNGTIWEKVDNTDAVTSVNGFIGAVNLTSANISEVTNLYFTNTRAISATLTGFTSGAGTITSSDTILSAIQKLVGNIAVKQDALVSGTNIKTVNGVGVLGSGNATIHPVQAFDYSVASGTNNYTVSIPSVTSLTTGTTITVQITNANTGTADIDVSSTGARAIRIGSTAKALVSGQLRSGGIYELIFNGTVWIVKSYLGWLRSIDLTQTGVISVGSADSITVLPNERIQRDLIGGNSSSSQYFEWFIPADFISFVSDSIHIDTRRNNASNTCTITMGKGGVADSIINALSVAATSTSNVWETKTAAPGSAYNPGDQCLFKISRTTTAGGSQSVGISFLGIKYLAV